LSNAKARLLAIKNRVLLGWQSVRKRKALSLLLDAALILAVFLAIHAWQTRNLPLDEAAPETVRALLDGSGEAAAIQLGEVGVVYFFAPWCFYCKTSIDNLDELVADGRIAWGTAVALDYEDIAEVEEFIRETNVSLPVLLGDPRVAADWGVRAFPTYYVIDAQGRISSRSVGYSTWLGMWARAWMAL
jgi:thiol-disulfide isomerase/thioredoxin